MVQAVEKECGSVPKAVTSDAGYRSEENFLKLEEQRINGYVSLGREGAPVSAKRGKKNLRRTLAWPGDLMAHVARIYTPEEKGSLSRSLGG
jgi:hypothetical protein